MRLNQKGFSYDVLLVLLVVVAVIGFAAYRVWGSNQAKPATPATAETSQTTLDSASHELDQMDGELDASLDDSALNVDLDSM